MSFPIAGRRAASSQANSTPSPLPQEDAVPDWLSTDAGVSGGSSPPPPASGRRNLPPPKDPLDFLNFDGDSSPPAARNDSPLDFLSVEPRPAPKQTSAPAVVDDDPLDFLNPSAGAAPAAAPVVKAPPPQSAVPDFLNFDDDVPAPATPQPAPQRVAEPVVARPDPQLKRMEELRQELDTINTSIRQSNSVIESFTNETHDLCVEVNGLDHELKELAKKKEEHQEQLDEKKKREEEDREKLGEDIQKKIELEKQSLRIDFEQQSQEELKILVEILRKQDEVLNDLRASYEEVKERSASVNVDDLAAKSLESRLLSLLDGIRSDFSMHAKPLLRRTLQENLSEAAQQRRDIFLKDTEERRTLLSDFVEKQRNEFLDFYKMHHEQYSQQTDLVFGRLKEQMEQKNKQRKSEANAKLEEYRQQILQSSERSYLTTQDAIEKGRRSLFSLYDQQKGVYAQEEQQLLQRLQANLSAFRKRLEEEKKCVLANHKYFHLKDSDGSSSPPVIDRAIEVTATQLLQRVRQVHLQVDAKAQSLTNDEPLTIHSVVIKDKMRQVDFSQSNAQEQVNKLNRMLAHIHASVYPIDEAAKTLDSAISAKRARLTQLHASSEQVSQVWRRDIRKLASGEGENKLDFYEGILSECVENVHSKVEQFSDKQRNISETRRQFVSALLRDAKTLEQARTRTNHSLNGVLVLYDNLHQANSTIQGQQVLLDEAMRSIVQDRTTVKKQRDYLERKRDELVEKVTLVKSLSGTVNQGCLPLSAVRDADLLLQRDNRFMHSRLTPSIPDSGSKGAMGDGGSTPECGSASTPAVIPPKKQHVVARSSVPPARHQSPSPVKPESSDAYWSSLPEMDDEDPLPKPEENDETIGGTEFSTSLVQLDDDSDVDLSHQRLASLVGAVNQRNGATPLDLPPSDPTGMGRSLSTPSSFY